MAESRMRFESGITLQQVNNEKIPQFLENLVEYGSFGDLYRPLDADRYRGMTVEYLRSICMTVRDSDSHGGLGFLVEQNRDIPRELQADVVHRTIVLANKLMVSNREVDKPFSNYEGKEIPLNDALNHLLFAIGPVMWEHSVGMASRISHIMSVDKERNFFPTLVAECMPISYEWFFQRFGKHLLTHMGERMKGEGANVNEDSTLVNYRRKLGKVLDDAERLSYAHGSYQLPPEAKMKFGRPLVEKTRQYFRI